MMDIMMMILNFLHVLYFFYFMICMVIFLYCICPPCDCRRILPASFKANPFTFLNFEFCTALSNLFELMSNFSTIAPFSQCCTLVPLTDDFLRG